jgi:membrane protein DedA with SNARE-associated domain
MGDGRFSAADGGAFFRPVAVRIHRYSERHRIWASHRHNYYLDRCHAWRNPRIRTRALDWPFVEAVLPARYTAAIDDWTKEQGTPVLLISRFLPVVSFNLINYAAGLTSVSWWTFLWTTGLGIAPLSFLMVFAGEEMISGSWKLALLLITACVALALLGYVIARRRKSRYLS